MDSMRAGRAAAQSSHASNAFIHKWGQREDVKEWQRQTKQGFGTAIVLGVTKEQMETVLQSKVIPSGLVIDPDYCIRVNREIAGLLSQNYDGRFCNFKFDYTNPEIIVISRKEATCAYIFGTKEELEPLLGALPLYE